MIDMKKLFFASLMLLLLPLMVSAAQVGIDMYTEPGEVFFKDSVLRVYRETYGSTTLNLYLDNKSLENDLVVETNSYYYTFPKDVVIKDVDYKSTSNNGQHFITITAHFESVNLSETKVHCYIEDKNPSEIEDTYYYFEKKYCDDYIEVGNYYSSNDILLIYKTLSNVSYYDVEGELLNHNRAQSEFLPKDGDKETFWAYTGTDNSGYKGYVSPVFEEYLPPKFELKCNPKTIKYGETSTCTLYGTVDLDLSKVNFDFDPKEYKVLGATFPKGITNKKGDKQYNLEISEDFDQAEEGFVLGVFEITGAQNKQYTDDVQIINLDYVDEKVQGKYENLKDPIEIVALAESTKEIKEEKNPDTASSLSIIIPVALFVVTVVIFFAVDSKKKIKKIS